MGNRLEEKVAVVTGSTKGIGRGIAVMLAQEGARVVVSGRDLHAGHEVAQEIRDTGGEAVFIQTDVTKEDNCERLIHTAANNYGSVDILVNNAGIFPRGDILETTEELWDEVMSVNLKGAFFCSKHAISIMKAQGKGSIINIGSGHGYGGGSNLFAYSVSKGGLLTMTKSLAKAYARDGIRVNWIIVGWVITPGEIAVREAEGHDEEWLKQQGKRNPFGRLQTPEDIAHVVVFLSSDEASQISGAEIPVSGGWVK
ncbi:glucose 1-dehydrogenase [Candidatus Poribacteria bacterium]|nr:glucose 1-dehydrogenase [Candidatus Poribacteria bacterium]